MDNPLLYEHGLPPFSSMTPDAVIPAIDYLLAQNREKVANLLQIDGKFDWANLVEPLEDMDDRLSKAWSPVSHMNSVVNSEALREVYNACLPKLTAYATEMGQNRQLFQAFKQLSEDDQVKQLDEAQRKIISNALRDFHLAGVDLPEDKKQRYKELMEKLSQLSSQYEEHVLDATHAWFRHIRQADELSGLPDSAMDLLAQYAGQKELDGWVVTLEFPSYLPVMMYADNRELRCQVYTAYVTRASEQSEKDGQWDNAPLMEDILKYRHEVALLLSYNNYAERSLVTKMAKTPEQVIQFLHDLARRSLPMAKKEFKELGEFARGNGLQDELQAWDVAYYSEKLRRHRYAISQEDLKPYFPAPQVINGLFAIVQRLFGLQIQARQGVETWHPEVTFYEIRDQQGELRGQFYLDLYARQKKRGGAWMDDCMSRKRNKDGLQNPVAYLTCNFTPPVGDKPSLLTHDEVQTLFHEFGHGLHHMLTRIDYPSVAGINGVAWDAVELPSQFLENWCWHREAIDYIAKHYVTGQSLPDAMYEKMLAAKNFQSGMQMVRQLEFALFDFRLHAEYDPAKGGRVEEIVNEVRHDVAVFKLPAFNRFANSFSHIFAGGYAAGYYSYKWAEVLSADAFSKFEEDGIFNQQTGKSFLQNILEKGGSREPMDLFVAFRGREPTIDALLKHNGIT